MIDKSRKHFPYTSRKVAARAFHPTSIYHTDSNKNRAKHNKTPSVYEVGQSISQTLWSQVKGLYLFFGKEQSKQNQVHFMKSRVQGEIMFGVKSFKA